MKKLFSPLFSLAFFIHIILVSFYAQSNAIAQNSKKFFNDTLEVHSINIESEGKSNGIKGIRVNLHYAILPDTSRKEMPKRIKAKLQICNSQDIYVQALTSAYQGSSHQLQQIVDLDNSVQRVSVFFPYYTMQLSEGQHKLMIKIDEISLRDTTAEDNRRVIPCKGTCKQGFIINKPPVEKFRMVIRGIRVSKKNFKGREWDFGTSVLPDIQCRIELATKDITDVMYYTPAMKNSFSAAWLDFSPEITISKGDVITITVYDSDTIFDDFIGKTSLTLKDLLAASKNNSELAFGKVTYFILNAEKTE